MNNQRVRFTDVSASEVSTDLEPCKQNEELRALIKTLKEELNLIWGGYQSVSNMLTETSVRMLEFHEEKCREKARCAKYGTHSECHK